MNSNLAEEMLRQIDALVRRERFSEQDIEQILKPKLAEIVEGFVKNESKTGA